jgi:glycerol-3-phosphate acyltransferase PlsY
VDLSASTPVLLACAVAAYLVGAVPVAWLIGRFVAGIDVREAGEGNVGARNVHHVIGGHWGTVAFLGDAAKGAIVAGALARSELAVLTVAGIAVFVGHGWPVWLRFVGGKGLSTVGGFVTVMAPLAALAGGVTAAIVWRLTRRFLPTTVATILATIASAPLLGVSRGTVALTIGLFALTGVKRVIDHRRMTNLQVANGWDPVRGLRP